MKTLDRSVELFGLKSKLSSCIHFKPEWRQAISSIGSFDNDDDIEDNDNGNDDNVDDNNNNDMRRHIELAL